MATNNRLKVRGGKLQQRGGSGEPGGRTVRGARGVHKIRETKAVAHKTKKHTEKGETRTAWKRGAASFTERQTVHPLWREKAVKIKTDSGRLPRAPKMNQNKEGGSRRKASEKRDKGIEQSVNSGVGRTWGMKIGGTPWGAAKDQ